MNIEIRANKKYMITNYDGEYFWNWSSYRSMGFNNKLEEHFNFNPNHAVVVFNSKEDAYKALEGISDKVREKEGASVISVEEYIKRYWNKFKKLPNNINISDFVAKVVCGIK